MLIALVLALAVTAPQSAPKADALTFSAPRKVVTLEKIKGEPTQLAWSPDGSQLYVQTGERTRLGTFQSPHHYLVNASDGKVKSVDDAPAWVNEYETWKGNKWAPADHSLVIGISEDKRMQNTVSAPMGGDLAKGGGSGGGTTAEDVQSAALTSQMEHVITLKLKGQTVGEYVDMQFIPGYTFSWAPESFGPAIAYKNIEGHLEVMDPQGGKKTVADTKNVFIPAWSDSGKQIAFLQKDGKKFDVYVTDVK